MATKTAKVQARIKPELKVKAEKILRKLNLNPTEAITMFYTQILLHKGLPFEVRIPTAETQKAIDDIEQGIGLKRFDNFDDFVQELES